MKIDVSHHCTDFNSYRASRVKSLFNVESGADFTLQTELQIDDGRWQIGVVVGPSGSGKSSIGRHIAPTWAPEWPADQPLIDAITPKGDFDAVASALSAVGLGSVPTWLRPYPVLSNGERFRAEMARLICEAPKLAVVDEFSSVVDRQIAQVGAGAFAKAWRRTGGRVVLLSCHYDVLDWLEPDWVLDTASGRFLRGCLWRRQRIELDIHQTDWSYWPAFKPHYYLDLPEMPASQCYVGSVDGQPVAHVAVSPRPGLIEARASRLVIMPEWQGAGIGLRFLNAICEAWKAGQNRFKKPMPMLFHTSHPLLATALRRDQKWTQVSARPFGDKSGGKFGGHFRSVQGFRYLGEA